MSDLKLKFTSSLGELDTVKKVLMMCSASNASVLIIIFVQLCYCGRKTVALDVHKRSPMNAPDNMLSDIWDGKEIWSFKPKDSFEHSDIVKERYCTLKHPVEIRQKKEEGARFHKQSTQVVTFPMDVSPCSTTYYREKVLVDCSYKGINAVNSSWFESNATSLLLDYNFISFLTKGTFSQLQRLHTLSISHNKLEKFFDYAFMGLESLEVLNLEYNNLIPKKSFPLNIFSSLLNLKSLLLVQEQSLRNASFPDLRRLTNLTTLSLDTVDVVVSFDEEFKELKVLSSLTLSGAAKVINNQSFINVPHLKELRLIILKELSEIDTQALVHLKHLVRLEINAIPAGVKKTMRALEPLQTTNMTEILLVSLLLTSRNEAPGLISHDGILDRNKTKYLLEICVSQFSLRNSNIYVVTNDALVSETWQACLKFIDLSDNFLKGTIMGVARLLTMRNLEVIFIRNCLRPRTKVSVVPDKTVPTGRKSDQKTYKNRSLKTNQSETEVNNVETLRFDLDPVSGLFVYVSDSLHFIDISNCVSRSGFDSPFTILGAQNLAYLDLSDNGFMDFTGKIVGLNGLQKVILSGNQLDSLSATFFDPFQRLDYLDMSETNLIPDFISASSERLFKKLSDLKTLSLERNFLSLLSPNTFSANRNITHLFLSGNRFNRVPFNLKNTPKLQVLDLQNNAISFLDQETTGTLDQLAADLGGFHLKLGGNFMLCVCENFRFLYWLAHTSVTLDRGGNFSCLNNDGVLSSTSVFVDAVAMWRQCSGQFYFNVSIFLLCTMIIGFLTTFVITRNKTLILSSLLQIFTNFKVLKSKDYRIGVFIGYADRDYVFACTDLRCYIENTLGLTTYLQDRDLLPTFDMAHGIVEAINSGWRILLVVNRTFLNDDHWSLFTMKSAIYALTPANPDRVVVLVDKQLLSELPGDLLSSVPEGNIITVSRWEMTYRLREMLRTRLL